MAHDSFPGGEIEGGRRETAEERADRNWAEIVQELRATQTGSLILSGFLLTLPFQQRFSQLEHHQVVLYLVLVALAATVTLIGLAPVGLHRMLFQQHRKQRLVAVGDLLLKIMLLLVAILALGVTVLLFDVVLGVLGES